MKKHKTQDNLVAFLYLLMRDHVVPAKIEKLVMNFSDKDTWVLSNGYLAEYAEDIVARLTKTKGN